MMSAWSSVLLGAACAAGIDVRVGVAGKLDVDAKGAPLAAILDCVAQNTGLKITNTSDPLPPRGVTVSLRGKTEVQIISELLTDAGYNFALSTDTSGKRGRVLLLVGKRSTATAGPSTPSPASSAPAAPVYVVEEATPAPVDPQVAKDQLLERMRAGDPAALATPLFPLPGPVAGPTPNELFPEANALSPMTQRESRRLPGQVAAAVSRGAAPTPASRD